MFPEHVPIGEAARLISGRLKPAYESERLFRDKVRKRIKYAIEQHRIITDGSDNILFNDLSGWVREKYPGQFDDWPLTRAGHAKLTPPRVSVSAYSSYLPNTLAECHARITELTARIYDLELARNALVGDNKSLRVDAEKWRNFCATSDTAKITRPSEKHCREF